MAAVKSRWKRSAFVARGTFNPVMRPAGLLGPEAAKVSAIEMQRAVEAASGVDIYMRAKVVVTVVNPPAPEFQIRKRPPIGKPVRFGPRHIDGEGSAKRIPIAAEHRAEAHYQGGYRAHGVVGTSDTTWRGGAHEFGTPQAHTGSPGLHRGVVFGRPATRRR